MIIPENVEAIAGQPLKDAALPEGWRWSDESTITSEETAEYPARYPVDDTKYNYTDADGYYAQGHYIEKMIRVQITKRENVLLTPAKIALNGINNSDERCV